MDVIATAAYSLKTKVQHDKTSKFFTMAKKIFDGLEFNFGYVFYCEYNTSK